MAKVLQNAIIHSIDIVEPEIDFVEKAKRYLKLKNITTRVDDA